MDNLLYRGISHQQFENLVSLKVLEPKGESFSLIFTYNGDFYHDGSLTYGESEQNAITMHQKDSDKYKTSGISTTPHLHRAIFYARGIENTSFGYILIFEETMLHKNEILLHVVKDHVPSTQMPEDCEVIIRSKDNSPIGIDCIKSIQTIDGTIIWNNA